MEDGAARAARIGLDSDGVSSTLFQLLWTKDLLSESSLSVRIPDTVIFKYEAPLAWYFTSVDGHIKRKTKAKLTKEHIMQEFLKKPSASGIVACFVSTQASQASGECDSVAKEQMPPLRTVFEYLDKDGLNSFLFERRLQPKPDGILQKFIEPQGESNNMVRALWSPKVCLLERRVNRLRLSDTRYDVYERAVTFEGPEFHSELAPVRGPSMMMQVNKIADSIVEHCSSVTNNRIHISRMALNFKVDHKDRLWLMFASSVRLHGELQRLTMPLETTAQGFAKQGFQNTPLELKNALTVPDNIRRTCSTGGRPAQLQQTWECSACEEKVTPGNLFEVGYKALIDYEEEQQRLRQASDGGQDERTQKSQDDTSDVASEVPPVLAYLHPRLTSEEYRRLRHTVAFLYKAASVCETCFLKYSGTQTGVGYVSNAVTRRPLVGTQALNPASLKERHENTRQRIAAHLEEEEGTEQELCRRKQKKLEATRGRAQSCPKLPSWGPGHSGAVVFPPAPVLSQVRPPLAPPKAPVAPAMRPSVSLSALRTASDAQSLGMEKSQKPRRVPPMRDAAYKPYLAELKAFASNCTFRADYVLPSAFGEILPPGARQGRTRSVGRKPKSEEPVWPESRSRTRDPEEIAPAAPSARSSRPPSGSRPLSGRPAARAVPSEIQVTPSPSNAQAPSPLNARSESADEHIDIDDGSTENEDEELPTTLAELWGRWPPTLGSATKPVGTATPITRTPSEAARTGTASGPPTRPASSRLSRQLSSRVWSADRASEVAVQGSMAGSRPASSPQLRGDGRGSPLAGSSAQRLGRPQSSSLLERQRRPASAKRGPSGGRRPVSAGLPFTLESVASLSGSGDDDDEDILVA
eukprot:TRINITY_DN30808_c0_g1_i1.p1 TRINITY_DN30808_c0_g1~~TRINITY_DN30808_c0_g1_i1.p1  ORF type:complete len:866 (-),score=175.97 TRINITY_DN30808_c0_g1_i1:161-2758(-)